MPVISSRRSPFRGRPFQISSHAQGELTGVRIPLVTHGKRIASRTSIASGR